MEYERFREENECPYWWSVNVTADIWPNSKTSPTNEPRRTEREVELLCMEWRLSCTSDIWRLRPLCLMAPPGCNRKRRFLQKACPSCWWFPWQHLLQVLPTSSQSLKTRESRVNNPSQNREVTVGYCENTQQTARSCPRRVMHLHENNAGCLSHLKELTLALLAYHNAVFITTLLWKNSSKRLFEVISTMKCVAIQLWLEVLYATPRSLHLFWK